MHETSLMQNLISIAEETLKEHNVKKVNSVTLSVGKLSNAMPDAIFFAFNAMTKSGLLKGAKLIMNEIPIKALCETCKSEFEPLGFPIACPNCNGLFYSIIQGEDIFIESLDCET